MMTEGDPSGDDANRPLTFEEAMLRIERAVGKQQSTPEGSIKASAADEQRAAEETETFEQAAAEEYARLKNRREELEQAGLEQDIKERKSYAGKIFVLVCVWLAAVLMITTASGAKRCPVTLSDSVLIALISGVSVNVIALFAIVARYLFPTRK